MEEAVLGRKNVVGKGFPSWESGGIAQSRWPRLAELQQGCIWAVVHPDSRGHRRGMDSS